jgi:hypothetical protein
LLLAKKTKIYNQRSLVFHFPARFPAVAEPTLCIPAALYSLPLVFTLQQQQQQENKSHGYGSASGAAAGKPKALW